MGIYPGHSGAAGVRVPGRLPQAARRPGWEVLLLVVAMERALGSEQRPVSARGRPLGLLPRAAKPAAIR